MPNLARIGLGVWVHEPQEFPTSVIFVWLCADCMKFGMEEYTMGQPLRAKLGSDRKWGWLQNTEALKDENLVKNITVFGGFAELHTSFPLLFLSSPSDHDEI